MKAAAMLYAITDRRLYEGDEAERRARLSMQTAVWAANGVAFAQLREKDLPTSEQVELARAMLDVVRKTAGQTRLLVNGRPDIALAAGADGVHLPSGPNTLTPAEARATFAATGRAKTPCISIACHTLVEVIAARQQAVDCILFAPVFEKIVRHDSAESQALPGTGLELLREACQLAGPVPVFALGGVTAENAAQCLHAGAAGVAAIRLMQGPPSAWLRLAGR
ncbi:MAG: thiamine phosphate synthase [Acidobacteriaceae bacterium]